MDETVATWIARLGELVEGVRGLKGPPALDLERGCLRIAAERPGRAGASVALKSEPLAKHLAAWPGEGDLAVCFAAEDEARPDLIVSKGRLMLVSSEPGDAPAVEAADFAGWFQATFGRPFPLPELAARMRPIGENLWADVDARPEQLWEWPYFLEVKGNSDHRVVGYSGYGSNSWACYFTDKRPGCSVRLRMPFGGAYGDPERDSAQLVETIAAVRALADELLGPPARLVDRLEVSENMGDLRVRLEKEGVGAVEAGCGFAQALFQEARRVAASLAEGKLLVDPPGRRMRGLIRWSGKVADRPNDRMPGRNW